MTPRAAIDFIPKAQQRSSRGQTGQVSLGSRLSWQPAAREHSKDPPMIGNWLRVALCCFLLGGYGCFSATRMRRRSSCSEAASMRRLTPRRSPMRSLSSPVASSPQSAAVATFRFPRMRVSIDCTGKTVVAGFWNSHVHFTQAVWKNAASAPAAPLEEHMQEMLTRWGFTTVWDLGSDPRNSLPLRQRINSGEVPGPNILLCRQHFPEGRASRLSAG